MFQNHSLNNSKKKRGKVDFSRQSMKSLVAMMNNKYNFSNLVRMFACLKDNLEVNKCPLNQMNSIKYNSNLLKTTFNNLQQSIMTQMNKQKRMCYTNGSLVKMMIEDLKLNGKRDDEPTICFNF